MEKVQIKLCGLHCSSCAVDIDLTLEETPGIKSSNTNYAKSESTITFNPTVITLSSIKKIVTNLGYQVI